MFLDLDKQDLINMILGVSPQYENINKLSSMGAGAFNGSYGTWNWSVMFLKSMSEEGLYNLYKSIKK